MGELVLRRYFKIFKALFQASFIADLEFRANLLMKVFVDFLWYAAQISVFEVLFYHAPQISGWTIDQARIFLAILFLVDSLMMLTYHENIEKMPERVRMGDLDLLLAKPVNSQFMLSLYKMNSAYLINIVLNLVAVTWLLSRAPQVNIWSVMGLVIAIICATIITYCLRFFFSATAVIFVRAENIVYVWYQIFRLGTRPDIVYPQFLRYIILFLIPVGFIASVPTGIVLGTYSPLWLFLALFFSISLLWASQKFWRYVLTKYSSASS